MVNFFIAVFNTPNESTSPFAKNVCRSENSSRLNLVQTLFPRDLLQEVKSFLHKSRGGAEFVMSLDILLLSKNWASGYYMLHSLFHLFAYSTSAVGGGSMYSHLNLSFFHVATSRVSSCSPLDITLHEPTVGQAFINIQLVHLTLSTHFFILPFFLDSFFVWRLSFVARV